MKVGIIGCGRIAEHHLKFLVKRVDVEIIGLVDKDINKAKQLGNKYRIANIFSSMDELLDFGVVDVLHILTPPQYHLELALKAIEKGIHILIEKPIALSFSDTQKILAFAEDKNVKVCPDYIQLFNPIVLKVKTAIQQNDLGKLILAECYLSVDLNMEKLKETMGFHWSYELPGGVMQNYITHPLYLILDWIGKPKKIITCSRQFNTLYQGLTDHVDVLIKGEKANGKITLTLVPKQENYYLKLFFERGNVIIDFISLTTLMEKMNNLPRSINRVMINFVRSHQLLSGSIQNIFQFLRKKIVSYHGIKYLIESFYGWINGNSVYPISKELILDVSYAEDNILKHLGKVHFDCCPRKSTQKNISKKKKILITGATGYLGTEVVSHLVNSGYYVRAYVRKTSRTELLKNFGVELVYGDIREVEFLKEAAQGMNIIIHIAAALKGSEEFMMNSCIMGTKNVVEAARYANIERVIYISSFSVYDYFHVKKGTVLNEESQLGIHSEQRGIYSQAKRQAEDIALSNFSCGGSAWTILRPSMIFGNGRDLISLLGPKVGNFIISLGRKEKHLKLIHVRDVARAIILVLEKDSTCNCVFNLSHEDQITVNDMIKKCFRKSELKKYHVVYVPYSIGLIGILMLKIIKVLSGKVPKMNRVRLSYNCKDLLASSQAFHIATGWRPEDKLLVQLTKEAEKLET
jgi:predicted dehydrogenase/nucleoside-diphosphate-sugar epimerase